METHQKIRAKLFRGREQHWGFTGVPLQAEFARGLYRYTGFIYSFLCLQGHAENNSGANSLGMARRGNAEKILWANTICINFVDDGIQIHTYHVTINGTLLMSVRASEPIGWFRRLEGKRGLPPPPRCWLEKPESGKKSKI